MSTQALLLHCQGANNSTTFTDSSPTPKTTTALGDAKIVTTQTDPNGNANGVGYFDGSGDGIQVTDHTDLRLGTGDFAIKFKIRFTSLSGYQTILHKGYVSTGGWLIQTDNGNGRLIFYTEGGAIRLSENNNASPPTVNINQWYSIRIERISTTLYLYRDDVLIDSQVVNAIDFNVTSDLYFGGGSGTGFDNFYYSGYLSDLEIIKDGTTYTSNTPPTDGNETHTLTKDSGSYTATGNALTNASDPDAGDTLSISVGAGTTVGTYGTLVLNGTTGAYTYTLDNAGTAVQGLYAGDSATDTFNYTVSDGNGGTDTSSIIITVEGSGELVTFEDWLVDATALRSILVEVDASISGVETTHYLSTRGYTTGGADTPANTNYLPVVAGGVQLTEELSLDGAGGLSYGDIEIYNLSGERDGWLDATYVWVNRPIRVYLGDLRWDRADYQLIFDGIVDNLDSKSRDRLNIKIRDKLQRLNSPVSDTKLGGSTSNADMLIPLCFGEVSNITPLLTDPATHEYQVHNGPIESIIEVRSSGVPASFTPDLSTGKFTLSTSPTGTVITASVQGDKPSAYSNTIADLVERIATGYGKSTTRFISSDLDAANLAAFDAAHTQAVGVYLNSRENCINVIQQLAASIGAQAVISRAGKLQLLQIALPPSGTPTEITAADMVEASLHIVQRVPVKSSSKLGYNKNWTVQNDLQTGIPEAHKDLFTEEYLTVTASDSTVAASYKLDAEPVQRDTLLQVTSEASAEATRELNMYKTPRTVYGFEGFSRLLSLELGAPVTITHQRFGLSSGKTGVVTKLQPDWINMRVQVEVLI